MCGVDPSLTHIWPIFDTDLTNIFGLIQVWLIFDPCLTHIWHAIMGLVHIWRLFHAQVTHIWPTCVVWPVFEPYLIHIWPRIGPIVYWAQSWPHFNPNVGLHLTRICGFDSYLTHVLFFVFPQAWDLANVWHTFRRKLTQIWKMVFVCTIFDICLANRWPIFDPFCGGDPPLTHIWPIFDPHLTHIWSIFGQLSLFDIYLAYIWNMFDPTISSHFWHWEMTPFGKYKQ